MLHLLATLKDVPLEIIREVLEKDKEFYKSQVMYLQHLWQKPMMKMKFCFCYKLMMSKAQKQ